MRTCASICVQTFVLRSAVSAWIFEEIESVPLDFGSIFWSYAHRVYTVLVHLGSCTIPAIPSTKSAVQLGSICKFRQRRVCLC